MPTPAPKLAAGLDYGTSHCALGVASAADGVKLVPVEGASPLLPSTLWAPMPDPSQPRRDAFGRPLAPGPAIALSGPDFDHLRFGSAAIEAHLAAPANGYFIKSPKSFLGASGLTRVVNERFLAIVGAMIVLLRQRAAAATGEDITHAVIGRPINFQGPGGADHNQRAETMLHDAARAAGLTAVEFLYEPLAAAFDFEARLHQELRTLVVDVGGGTTDVSFVLLGPSRAGGVDRSADVLGHAGERVGGNDFDQLLALKQLMPHFGLGSQLDSGLPVPNNVFVDAVTVNDVNAQNRFYSPDTGKALTRWEREADRPDLINRLVATRRGRLSYRLVRSAELAKIELSNAATASTDLNYVDAALVPAVRRETLADDAGRLLQRIEALIDDACRQGGAPPEVVYLTGGMAGSPLVRARIARCLPDVQLVDGDHFASVVEGLTIHAGRVFR